MVSFLFLFLGFFSVNEHTPSGKIELNIKNLKNHKGSILISLFNQNEGFPDNPKKSFRNWKVHPTSIITLSEIPKGQYALSIVHDEDGSNGMTYNLVKMPKEGFGVSNYELAFLQKPDFRNAVFAHHQKVTSLSIRLRY